MLVKPLHRHVETQSEDLLEVCTEMLYYFLWSDRVSKCELELPKMLTAENTNSPVHQGLELNDYI